MKIDVFGNSQAMSLPHDGQLVMGYFDHLSIMMGGKHVRSFVQSGGTIENLIHLFHQGAIKRVDEPHYFVIQYGIVECCPRVLLKSEVELIEKWFSVKWQRRVKNFIHRHRAKLIRSIGLRVEMNEEVFVDNLKHGIELAHSHGYKAIIVGIPQVPLGLEMVSPGIRAQIDRYNELLQNISKISGVPFCCLDGVGSEGDYFEREVHFRDSMARVIAEKIAGMIKDSTNTI